jgi:hypothetical protein
MKVLNSSSVAYQIDKSLSLIVMTNFLARNVPDDQITSGIFVAEREGMSISEVTAGRLDRLTFRYRVPVEQKETLNLTQLRR